MKDSFTPAQGAIRAIGTACLLNLAVATASFGQDPVLWINFNDGTAADYSGNSLDGVLEGGAEIVEDPERGMVLSLNGSTAHVPIADPNGLLDFSNGRSATVAAWINHSSKVHNQVFAQGEWNDGAGLALKGDTAPPDQIWTQGQGGGTAQRSDIGVPQNAWHHVAITFSYDEGADTLQVAFYLDGELTGYAEGGDPQSGGLNAPAGGGNTIGREQRGGPDTARWFFDGMVDDLQIYDVALDQEGIQRAMAGVSLEVEAPIAADFGSVRFIDFLDHVTTASFEMAPISAGDSFYMDEEHTVTVLPEILAGNFAFKTRNEFPETVLLFGGQTSQTYIDTNLSPATLEYPISFSIWTHRFDDGTARNKVFGWFFNGDDNRGELEIDTRSGNTQLRLVWWGGDRINAPVPPTNQWVHLGVVITEDDARLYVDGVLAGSLGEEGSPLPLNDGSDLWIGARANPDNHEDSFSGWLKDWIVFDGDIGDEGMEQLAGQNGIPEFDIIQHLPMNEGEGDVAFDSSIQEQNGDLNGPEWTETVAVPESELASYIGFVVDRDTTVFIAYDANATAPAWISGHYTNSGLSVQTTGGDFDLWQKDFNARDQVMLLTSERAENENNYWVILSQGPEAVTVPVDRLFNRTAANSDDWSLGAHAWMLSTAADAEQHTAGMLTNISNLEPGNGFGLATTIRAPRLQNDGDNAFGFVLLGDPNDEAQAILAEWLPREANGEASLRLVDGSSGNILAQSSWSGMTPTAVDNNVGVGTGAEETVFAAGISPYVSEVEILLSEDFQDGGSGWTSGSFNDTANQWEIGVPTTGPGDAFTGQNVAATRLDEGYATESASWLRSPVVDLTGIAEATLSFQEYSDVDTFSDADGIYHFAMVTVLNADTFAEEGQLAMYSESILEWTERQLDLTAFAGRQIVLEFAFFSDNVMNDAGEGWYIDDIQVTGQGASIMNMPATIALDGTLHGIATESDGLDEQSDSYLEFTVSDRAPAGNDGVTVYVAWDTRASGLEPNWLRNDFTLTDHVVGLTGGATHRLWAREYTDGAQVTLGGASAGGAGPFPANTNNYFVLFGDARPGLETLYTLTAEGAFDEGSWSINFSLTDAGGNTETVSATIEESLDDRNRFGLFARHPDAGGGTVTYAPIWEVFDLSIDFLETPPGSESDFQAWREEHFAGQLDNPEISGPNASPAGDGVTNLMKYALDLSPLTPVTSADLPPMDLDEDGRLILVYWERSDINDIEYIPQVSEDLVIWESGEPHMVEFLRGPGDQPHLEEVGVRGVLSEDATKGFLRLMIRQLE